VLELLLARRRRTRAVLLASGLQPAPIIDHIIELAREQRASVRQVGRAEFDSAARSAAPQGVIAYAEPLKTFAAADLLRADDSGDSRGSAAKRGLVDSGGSAVRRGLVDSGGSAVRRGLVDSGGSAVRRGLVDSGGSVVERGLVDSGGSAGGRGPTAGPRPPFLLALDGITDPRNLGAVLRTAECAGVTGVIMRSHRAVRITPTVAKAAAGAIEHLRLAVVPGLPSALRALSSKGVWTVGLDPAGKLQVHELDLAGEAVTLVLGAEGKGLSRLAAQRCDVLVSIPMRGALASLNVSAAAAVACFEIARRRD